MRERSLMKSLFFGAIDEGLVFPWPEAPGPEVDRMHVLLDSARRFFELLGKQQIAERSCGSLQQLQQRFAEVSKLIQNAKLTAVDRVRFEQQTLDREMDCLQAESVRKVAAFQLAAAMGVGDDEVAALARSFAAMMTALDKRMETNDQLYAAAQSRLRELTGLAEIARLGVAAGARQATFAGLSGLGDLIATCSSPLSRNYHVGYELGRGRTLDEVRAEMSSVAEGVTTTRAALDLAARYGVELPIVAQVGAVLFEGKDPHDAVTELLTRAARDELTGAAL